MNILKAIIKFIKELPRGAGQESGSNPERGDNNPRPDLRGVVSPSALKNE